MLTIKDLEILKEDIENHSKKRIQLETEMKLIKEGMKKEFGVDTAEDADKLIKDLSNEQEEIKKKIETKLKNITDAMKKDGLL